MAEVETPSDAGQVDTPLAEFIGYAMKRALSIVQADLSRVLGGFGLRAVSFSALSIVVAQPGLTQTQLADALQIERSNLVTILDELSGRGLIIRAPVAQDRRRHALMATAEGQTLAQAAQTAVKTHERALFSCLTPEEQHELKRLLTKFRGQAGA
ncbi:MarR family winged helix-turn-helix transcriptional regulator [Stagnihabitans tardus]|uniref:MarR family transcriptional regulator n=1 Tax=Stagnihabitans tardus TaxID=2699202 RepID=A0AAE4YAQ1_9RHOB|nr:MarR family transcriptional regulator [Stagnihabitans tardus]NBZ89157.1 MarR family transcriptional regulator [Stagnihabitans tardus]